MLSKSEVDDYILKYFSHLIDDPIERERERLLETAHRVVRRNIDGFGLPSSVRLHETLDEILDRHRYKREISLDVDLTGNLFNLYNVIPSGSDSALLHENIGKGKSLARFLEMILPRQAFRSLISRFGGFDRFIYLLGESNLTPEALTKEYSLSDIVRWLGKQPINTRAENILWLGGLPIESRNLFGEYHDYAAGRRRWNPIQRLDLTSIPVIQRVVLEAYKRGVSAPRTDFVRMGFYHLIINEGGISRIVKQTNPELFIRIPSLFKWRRIC